MLRRDGEGEAIGGEAASRSDVIGEGGLIGDGASSGGQGAAGGGGGWCRASACCVCRFSRASAAELARMAGYSAQASHDRPSSSSTRPHRMSVLACAAASRAASAVASRSATSVEAALLVRTGSSRSTPESGSAASHGAAASAAAGAVVPQGLAIVALALQPVLRRRRARLTRVR